MVVFPNPASTTLTIQSSSPEVQILILRNILGEIIFKDSMTLVFELSLTAIASGIYQLRVGNENHNIVIHH